jgi:AhpD family alkylhydroperoxidase
LVHQCKFEVGVEESVETADFLTEKDWSEMNLVWKKKYNIAEYYWINVFVFRAIGKLAQNNRRKMVSKQFLEKIMLAVTQVNGCALCSYAHTKMALKEGFSREEIASLLNGDKEYILAEEAKAILFAEHYADQKGIPDQEMVFMLQQEYPNSYLIILAGVQVMMFGNGMGLPYSAFLARLKGKKYPNSSLLYELGMMIGMIIVFPIALIHALLRFVFNKKNWKIKKIEENYERTI